MCYNTTFVQLQRAYSVTLYGYDTDTMFYSTKPLHLYPQRNVVSWPCNIQIQSSIQCHTLTNIPKMYNSVTTLQLPTNCTIVPKCWAMQWHIHVYIHIHEYIPCTTWHTIATIHTMYHSPTPLQLHIRCTLVLHPYTHSAILLCLCIWCTIMPCIYTYNVQYSHTLTSAYTMYCSVTSLQQHIQCTIVPHPYIYTYKVL